MRNKEGKAMILVVIAMAVMTTFSLAILLVVSSLFTTQSDTLDNEQCRIMAVSLSEEIEKQLTGVKPESIAEEQNMRDTLWYYVKSNIFDYGNWNYYNEEERGHTSKFAFKNFDISNGTISEERGKNLVDKSSVIMYWESERDASDQNGATFVVIVNCRSGSKSCSITNEFKMENSDFVYKDEDGNIIETYTQWTWSFNGRE